MNINQGLVIDCVIFCRLSFALSASTIKEKARVVAVDLRGHGKTVTDDDLDLSIEVMEFKLANATQTCRLSLVILIKLNEF